MGNEWIKKLWDINTHTHTHYPVIENKVLTFEAKRTKLGDISLSERGWIQKDKRNMFFIICKH